MVRITALDYARGYAVANLELRVPITPKTVFDYKTLELRYSGGEPYPNLLREPGTEDLLAHIAHPLVAATP